ncbi:hypothetical protein DPMN_012404 [Dreissena polymorpha]|uniref:Uncharacterized protein n=1 Tax=Dreissena polymorpha TaxID=45954 RepID=A0A9D4N5S4_DREPO|nr:hypothetical protein DPMN_012404 [Dreissena polymorpha]
MFWKRIAKTGIGMDRMESIPMQVVLEHSTVSDDVEIILAKWRHDFCTLLNPDNTVINVANDGTMYIADENLDSDIDILELVKALRDA